MLDRSIRNLFAALFAAASLFHVRGRAGANAERN